MTKKQIDIILTMCDSWDRFETFLKIAPQLKGKFYWYALGYAYTLSDDIFHLRGLVKDAFKRNEPQREYLMSKKERDYLNNLPEKITIYRGMTEQEQRSKDFGVSWTLKREVAEFIAYKYWRNRQTNGSKRVVHELEINKKDAIAFINGRQEFEIIYINS